MRLRLAALPLAVAALCIVGWSAATVVAAPPSTDTPPPTTELAGTPLPTVPGQLPAAAGPLVVVPAGCASPPAAVAVFEATIVGLTVDAARMQVTRMLAGSLDGYEISPSVVDVRYGDEVRFLEIGTDYLVGAGSDDTTLLRSAVRDPRPLFGGDAVVGLDDSDIDCPELDDPVRTFLADGSLVDASLLTPLAGSGDDLRRAVLLPVAVAMAVLLALVVVKHLVFAFGRALRDSVDPDEA
ncbi:MAG: hypothetical protein ACKO27_10390 [Ilumatobacteraceae bacterium]